MLSCFSLFFFNDTATTEIYTLSLHDALPISNPSGYRVYSRWLATLQSSGPPDTRRRHPPIPCRSEEHTSELQSRLHLVCRLLLEKKKTPEGDRYPVDLFHHDRVKHRGCTHHA